MMDAEGNDASWTFPVVPTVPINHVGPIPGVAVGSTWRSREEVSMAGVHRPPQSGIHGRSDEGAFSIVLSGKYQTDEDFGDVIFYTGNGGCDFGKKNQVFDQQLTRENLSLARSCPVPVDGEGAWALRFGDNHWRRGRPIRVVRKATYGSWYAPSSGLRYDGIYKVVGYYPQVTDNFGLKVWMFVLQRDDESPLPWREEPEPILAEAVYGSD